MQKLEGIDLTALFHVNLLSIGKRDNSVYADMGNMLGLFVLQELLVLDVGQDAIHLLDIVGEIRRHLEGFVHLPLL
jgi:hypothetical protein